MTALKARACILIVRISFPGDDVSAPGTGLFEDGLGL
jgi:hypothetical protein